MSYAFLFKYIIIGDTGKYQNHRFKVGLISDHLFRCWQVVPIAPIY